MKVLNLACIGLVGLARHIAGIAGIRNGVVPEFAQQIIEPCFEYSDAVLESFDLIASAARCGTRRTM